jgi:hypothetical protein
MFAAIAASVLTAVAAFAQAPSQTPADPAPAASANVPASRCPALPAEPQLPDGGSSTRTAMNRAGEVYEAWGQQMQTILQCRRTEAQELRAAAEAAATQAETRIKEFNAGTMRLNAVHAAWKEEVDQFNNRGRRKN